MMHRKHSKAAVIRIVGVSPFPKEISHFTGKYEAQSYVSVL